MNWVARTLWDLIAPPKRKARLESTHAQNGTTAEAGSAGKAARRQERHPAARDRPAPNGVAVKKPAASRRLTMQDRYDALVKDMKLAYGIRVRKWRKSSSGCAWQLEDDRGNVTRLIESPYPRGPMSCAIFLHEVGHHAIGFGTYKPRCLEEYHAWRWALQTMRDHGLNVTAPVEKRMAESLTYAVAKARRRGLKRLPAELVRYCPISGAPANGRPGAH